MSIRRLTVTIANESGTKEYALETLILTDKLFTPEYMSSLAAEMTEMIMGDLEKFRIQPAKNVSKKAAV